MKKNLKIIDTNVIIRYLVADNITQFEKSKEYISTSRNKTLWITDPVFCEIVFVLEKVYLIDKNRIYHTMKSLIQNPKFYLNIDLLESTIEIFNQYKISIIDSYLAALSNKTNYSLITFDKKLSKTKFI